MNSDTEVMLSAVSYPGHFIKTYIILYEFLANNSKMNLNMSFYPDALFGPNILIVQA